MKHLAYGITRTSRVVGQDGELQHDRLPEPVAINRPFTDTSGNWAYTFDGVTHGGHTSYHDAEAEAIGFIRGLLAFLDAERPRPEGTLLRGGIVLDRNHYVAASRRVDVAVVQHQDAWGYMSDGNWRGPFGTQMAAEDEALGFARALLYADGHRDSSMPTSNTWLVLTMARS